MAGEPNYGFASRMAGRVACPRCTERRNVCLGQLENVWYFVCHGCESEFRLTFDVEDICDHAGRI